MNDGGSFLPYLPWVARTVWRTAPLEAGLNVLAGVLQGFGPAVVLPLLQRLIDTITQSRGDGLLQPLLWLGLALVLAEGAGALWPITNVHLLEKTNRAVQRLIMAKAATLTMDQFDEAATHDLLARASDGQGERTAQLWNLAGLAGSDALRASSAVLILAGTSPWLAVVGCLSALPIGWMGMRSARRLWQTDRELTTERRRTEYLTGLMANRQAAPELRAYQLASHFIDRWKASFQRMRAGQLQATWRKTREGWTADLTTTALLAGALAWVTLLAGQGQISAGRIVALLGAVQMLQANVSQAASWVAHFWEKGLPLVDLHRFLNLPVAGRPGTRGVPFPAPLTGPIRFENVSFAYPGQGEPMLHQLSFAVYPGETVALVGVNGAGKSTLIRLLLGLYQPSAGRITVDGVNLAEIAPNSLCAHVSCIFQDFVRYDLTVRENVSMGRPGATQAQIEAACVAAGAAAMIDRLPNRYETLLGRLFTGGVELSGGQWQRIALARAMVRDAQVLVLDEPTAALDARAELELFNHFTELASGRTAILISHRLGSARRADRIIVLDQGRIAEMGDHDTLLGQDGIYASLFRAQAHWYQETAPDEAVVS